MADIKKARREKFENVFEKIRDELVNHLKGEGMPDEAVEWYRQVSFPPKSPLLSNRPIRT